MALVPTALAFLAILLAVGVTIRRFAILRPNLRVTRLVQPISHARSRFFADDVSMTPVLSSERAQLLLQVERHVHLERAAAEAFCDCPTAERLRIQTMSPLRAVRACP